jgi:N-acetylglucosaminyldiphosphoundecaprenol N-acetyl-beta-D-mannosaminyltransferase
MTSTNRSPTCTLCSLPILRASMQEVLAQLHERIARSQGTWLLTLNTEMLARCARDDSYHELIRQADIITADGMPLVWASRYKNAAIKGRTTGVDLVDAYLRALEIPNFAVIGGQDPMVTLQRYEVRARQACRYLFDGKVDLSDTQLDEFANALVEHKVKVVFIALGVPKQDRLALELRARLPHLVLTGIGGTFEILGPNGGRAPAWMRQMGLEWFYRLTKEPGRLWRRYVLGYPAGLRMLLNDCLRPRT